MSGVGHLQALLGALGRLVRSPFSTLLTLLVIALALALPASLRLLVSNAQATPSSCRCTSRPTCRSPRRSSSPPRRAAGPMSPR
jgi:hypothetical protein